MSILYSYIKAVASDRLESEIRSSSITKAIDYISVVGTSVSIYFKDTLSEGEVAVLDALVSSHVATNLPQNLVSSVKVEESPPFATPTYRTKRSRTNSIITISPNETKHIDFQMTHELYASGGGVIYTGAELGDHVTACIYDKDEIIPQPYRAALCESWPTVAEYIVGEWVPKGDGRYEINTYPLNAKITAGLYLRITYVAADAGADRKIGVNYYLSKKL